MAGKTTRQLWIELEDFVERVVNNASAHEIGTSTVGKQTIKLANATLVDHEWYGQRYDNLSDFAKGELETLLPQVHKLGPPATYPSDLSNAAEVDSFRRAASSRIRFLDDQIWDLEAIIGMEDELPGSDVPRYLKIELHRRKILLEDLRKHFDNLDDAVKTHKDEIRRRRGDLGPGWWHGPTFGRGGYGDASLCIKRNWYGNIIDVNDPIDNCGDLLRVSD